VRNDIEKSQSLVNGVPLGIRIDGCGFHSFAEINNLVFPYDQRLARVMAAASMKVIEKYDWLEFAYTSSDEVTFFVTSKSKMYSRRSEKLCSVIVSSFTSAFLEYWFQLYDGFPKGNVAFDARAFIIPNTQTLDKYLSWRQVDSHLNCTHGKLLHCYTQNGLSIKEATARIEAARKPFQKILAQEFEIDNKTLPHSWRLGVYIGAVELRNNGHHCAHTDELLKFLSQLANVKVSCPSLILGDKHARLQELHYIF